MNAAGKKIEGVHFLGVLGRGRISLCWVILLELLKGMVAK